MKKTHWDNWILEKILKNSKYDLNLALSKTIDYNEKYEEDYYGYCCTAQLMLDLKLIEETEKYLNTIKPGTIIFSKCLVKKNIDEIKTMKYYYNLNLLRLKIYQNKYEEAYQLLPKCKKLKEKAKPTYMGIKNYLELYFGIDKVSSDLDGYLKSQIRNYNKDKFLEHIKKHNYNENQKSYFNSDFDSEKIVLEIEKLLPNDKHTNRENYIGNNYIFKYDNCGYIKNTRTNYFEVITLKDTNKLITMYPCDYGKNYDYIDINYLKEEKKSNVKRLSQIEKFNKKYGK